MRRKTKKKEPEKDERLINASETNVQIKTVEPTLKEAMLHYRTPYIWVLIVLSSSFPFYIASNFKSYESIDVDDEKFITIVGSIGAVVNGLSRGVWSTLQDYFGFKKIYLTLLTLELIIAFTFVLIHKIKALYLIWVMVSFA